jgi:hypothetical protein
MCTPFECLFSLVAYFYNNDNWSCFFHITIYMEHSAWEANTSSARQEIPCIFQNL